MLIMLNVTVCMCLNFIGDRWFSTQNGTLVRVIRREEGLRIEREIAEIIGVQQHGSREVG